MVDDRPTGSSSRPSADGAPGSNRPEEFNDPLAGFGGLPPARSALTLRAVLATFGLIFCASAAIALYGAGAEAWMVAILAILAVVGVIDLLVIFRRKQRRDGRWSRGD